MRAPSPFWRQRAHCSNFQWPQLPRIRKGSTLRKYASHVRLSFLLIRVRHEAHISAEVVSGKYFILNKLLQHETLGCGMRAVQTNTSWQPIRSVCGDCRCDPKVNGSLLLLSGKAHKPSHTCEVPLALCYWMYWQTFGAWCFRVSLIFFLSISNENI